MPLSTDVKREATALGFDLCGIAPADVVSRARSSCASGSTAAMPARCTISHRSADRRRDVRAVLPSARSVIVLATVYNVERPYSNESSASDRAAIARYAWGDDYHLVIEKRLDQLMSWLRSRAGSGFEARAYVDTGPVQERVYAQYAGIGWIGKNTCVINEELGSWMFLSVVISNLALEPDSPALDQCGTCARCLDACPTGALVEPHVMDATKCLSYLTIELKGAIPDKARADVAHHVYGCDICQDVCPWNLTPSTGVSSDGAWLPRSGLDGPTLLELWQRSDDDLRALLKGSAMKRAGVTRLRRNLAVAVGNSGVRAAAAHSRRTTRRPAAIRWLPSTWPGRSRNFVGDCR